MCGTKIYRATDKMSDLICENYALLQVLSRFGVPLGFGDRSVKEVCEMNQVDCNTFLTVVNFLTEGGNRMQDHVKEISVSALRQRFYGYCRTCREIKHLIRTVGRNAEIQQSEKQGIVSGRYERFPQ